MALTSPIVSRRPDELFSFIAKPIEALAGFSGIVTCQDFLSHVRQLATLMPNHKYAFNLCENRYLFMVAFCAAIVRGQVNLLPPNKKRLTLQSLARFYPDCYFVHDGAATGEMPELNLAEVCLADTPEQQSATFDVPLDRLAAISFTSGSTGDSEPNLKSWRVVIESSKNNAKYMLEHYRGQLLFQLATVPPQHMWGLETSVFLPLFESVCIADTKPLFPLDIAEGLRNLPEPRMLVTTPVHLRALCTSQLAFPQLKLLLCATSPLDQKLARDAEGQFCSELREVFGCSEIGSMAIRRTAQDTVWLLFSGINIHVQDAVSTATTSYLPGTVILQDKLAMLDKDHFLLKGRTTDMVDIAGKRGSLFEINKRLLEFPGIVDGIVFLPESDHAVPRLAALVVLNKQESIDQLKIYLRQHLDDAFIPRPLLEIEGLPREENGKLPLRRLNKVYRELIDARSTRVAARRDND